MHINDNELFILYPNPAKDIVTLELNGDKTQKISTYSSDSSMDRSADVASSTYEVQLWSGTTLVRKFKSDQPTLQIPVSGLSKGIYFVHVIKDGVTHRQQLIIK